MNVFYLDECPIEAAVSQVDKHVVKMVLESSQILSTAHRVLDGEKRDKAWVLQDAREGLLYKATHINHPSSLWARQSVQNYTWLSDHLRALLDEYTHRYGRRHKVDGELAYALLSPPHALRAWDFEPPPRCMPDEYKVTGDPVLDYRLYYRLGKVHLHRWTRREPPNWMEIPCSHTSRTD